MHNALSKTVAVLVHLRVFVPTNREPNVVCITPPLRWTTAKILEKLVGDCNV